MKILDSNFEFLNENYPDLNINKQNDSYVISGPVKLDHLYGDVRIEH